MRPPQPAQEGDGAADGIRRPLLPCLDPSSLSESFNMKDGDALSLSFHHADSDVPVWDASFKTGILAMDLHHQHLFERLANTSEIIHGNPGREVVGPLLRALHAHAIGNFAWESRLMRTYEYPDRIRHESEHEAFANRLTNFLGAFREGHPDAPATMLRFVSLWITAHIQDEDIALSRWLSET
jgi:hemerythrin